jgi:hypothetical protein
MAAQTIAYSAVLPCSRAGRVSRKSFVGAPLAQQQLVRSRCACFQERSLSMTVGRALTLRMGVGAGRACSAEVRCEGGDQH